MKRKTFLILILFALILVAAQAHAATDVGTVTLPWSSTLKTPEELWNRVANWFIAIAGPLAVVAVAYSGVMYIMSQNTESAGKARQNLTWAIIGIVVIVLSFLIIKEVAGVFK
jgi:amino acid transporter